MFKTGHKLWGELTAAWPQRASQCPSAPTSSPAKWELSYLLCRLAARLKGNILQGGSDSWQLSLFLLLLFNNLFPPGSSSSLASLQPNPLPALYPRSWPPLPCSFLLAQLPVTKLPMGVRECLWQIHVIPCSLAMELWTGCTRDKPQTLVNPAFL